MAAIHATTENFEKIASTNEIVVVDFGQHGAVHADLLVLFLRRSAKNIPKFLS